VSNSYNVGKAGGLKVVTMAATAMARTAWIDSKEEAEEGPSGDANHGGEKREPESEEEEPESKEEM